MNIQSFRPMLFSAKKNPPVPSGQKRTGPEPAKTPAKVAADVLTEKIQQKQITGLKILPAKDSMFIQVYDDSQKEKILQQLKTIPGVRDASVEQIRANTPLVFVQDGHEVPIHYIGGLIVAQDKDYSPSKK